MNKINKFTKFIAMNIKFRLIIVPITACLLLLSLCLHAHPTTTPYLEGITSIATGIEHTVAIKKDGTVWAWGQNDSGQLGDGSFEDSPVPVQTKGLKNVVAVAAGFFHTLAVKKDGTVWAWGSNSFNLLGSSSAKEYSTIPLQVEGLSDVVAVAAGTFHNIALKKDGTVWTWGYNNHGQLGHERSDQVTSLGQVEIKDVVAIAAGDDHCLALDKNGRVWTWGRNWYGQLGRGILGSRHTLKPIGGLEEVKAIAAGRASSIALKKDGTVWTWGWISKYSLGLKLRRGIIMGEPIPDKKMFTPAQVKGLNDVVLIATADWRAVVVKKDGSVWTFGTESGIPIQIHGLKNAIAAATSSDHTAVLINDGTVWTWGKNDRGQLGHADSSLPEKVIYQTSLPKDEPLPAPGLGGIKAISAGDDFSIALRKDGTPLAWGNDYQGKLGDLSHLTDIVAISAGDTHTLAIKNDGTVWGWGSNYFGELGRDTGTFAYSITPAQVKGLDQIVAVSAGSSHSVALKKDKTVWAWGMNRSGQLGNNSYEHSLTPVQVVGLDDVVAIAAGCWHTVALKSDGTVWDWGENKFTFKEFSPVPEKVEGLDNVVAIAAGRIHTVALKSDGTIWVRAFERSALGEVKELRNVTAIAAGNDRIMVIKKDGTLWGWGDNSYGQLGDNTTHSSFVPVMVKKLKNVVAVDTSLTHTVALRKDGTVWEWGENRSKIPAPVNIP